MLLRLILSSLPLLWLVLNQQGEGGTNQGGSQGQPPQPPQGGPQNPPQGGNQGQDWQQALNNLMQRQGGADPTAALLFQENRQYRDRIRELEQRVPGEGAVVLTGDQAQHWQAFSQLGNPAEVQQRLTAAEQATTELASLRRAETVRNVAEAAGYNATVLQRLADGLTLELREQQVDGQTVRVPSVVTGENQAQPLAEYAQQHWADFLPALQAQGGPQQQQQTQGVTYPRQQGQGGQPASNYVGNYFERAYAHLKKE